MLKLTELVLSLLSGTGKGWYVALLSYYWELKTLFWTSSCYNLLVWSVVLTFEDANSDLRDLVGTLVLLTISYYLVYYFYLSINSAAYFAFSASFSNFSYSIFSFSNFSFKIFWLCSFSFFILSLSAASSLILVVLSSSSFLALIYISFVFYSSYYFSIF